MAIGFNTFYIRRPRTPLEAYNAAVTCWNDVRRRYSEGFVTDAEFITEKTNFEQAKKEYDDGR